MIINIKNKDYNFMRIIGAELFQCTPAELLVIYNKVLAKEYFSRNTFSFPAKKVHRDQVRNQIRFLASDLRNLKALMNEPSLVLDFKNALFTRLKALSDEPLVFQAETSPEAMIAIKRYINSVPSAAVQGAIKAMDQGFIEFLLADELWNTQINEMTAFDVKVVLLGNCVGFCHSNLEVKYSYRYGRNMISDTIIVGASFNPMNWGTKVKKVLSARFSEFIINSVTPVPRTNY